MTCNGLFVIKRVTKIIIFGALLKGFLSINRECRRFLVHYYDSGFSLTSLNEIITMAFYSKAIGEYKKKQIFQQ